MSAKKTPPPTPEALRAALGLIEKHGRFSAQQLEAELRADHGLTLRKKFAPESNGRVRMLGIEAEGASFFDAADLWARKARRELLGAR